MPRTFVLLAAVAVASFIGPAARYSDASMIADSVADFSGVQGQGGWRYGYYAFPFNPSGFVEFDRFTGDAWTIDGSNVWTELDNLGGHANHVVSSGGRDSVNQWPVRRFVAPGTGELTFSGNIADIDSAAGDGVLGRIFVGGNEILMLEIPNGNSSGLNFEFTSFVEAGDTIDFVIDPGGSDLRDQTRFAVTISIPEPTTLATGVLAVGSLGVACRRWRR